MIKLTFYSIFSIGLILLNSIDCNSVNGKKQFSNVGIGLPCSNRRWASESNKVGTGRRVLVAHLKNSRLPVFNNSIYLAGVYNRVQSDKMLTNMYANLSSLVLVECVDYKGEYIQTIEKYLNNIVNAKSWTSTASDKNFDYFYGRIYWVEEYSSKTNFLNFSEIKVFLFKPHTEHLFIAKYLIPRIFVVLILKIINKINIL